LILISRRLALVINRSHAPDAHALPALLPVQPLILVPLFRLRSSRRPL
jgi:hypothetical protein